MATTSVVHYTRYKELITETIIDPMPKQGYKFRKHVEACSLALDFKFESKAEG